MIYTVISNLNFYVIKASMLPSMCLMTFLYAMMNNYMMYKTYDPHDASCIL